MKKIILLVALVVIGFRYPTEIKRGCLSLLILIDSIRPPEKALMGELIDGPTRINVAVPGAGRTIHADLYRPYRQGSLFPLLLVHGVNPAGKDDKHLALLANDLARSGMLVLVPDFEGMKTRRIGVSDVEEILQSYLYLRRVEQTAPRGGMIGFGLGAGPMLLAAADPRIRERVNIVATFGGYYDLRNVLSFMLTGAYEYGGCQGHVRPEAVLRWKFASRNLDLLHSSNDRMTFRKVIDKRSQHEIADAESLVKSLGPEGRTFNDFLVNVNRERFTPLYENLPLPAREQVYQLSPARAIKQISASFTVVHATDDSTVPYTESMRIADAVGEKDRVSLALLPQFMHGGPDKPSVGDLYQRYVLGGWRLFSATYELLEKTSQE